MSKQTRVILSVSMMILGWVLISVGYSTGVPNPWNMILFLIGLGMTFGSVILVVKLAGRR